VLDHLSTDSAGNADITLADGKTITLEAVSSTTLSAGNFVFNETPVMTNAGTMTIGNGAMLPLSGIIDNSGTIALAGAGSQTLLQVIQTGITLQGGGHVVLSDDASNLIAGTLASVGLVNVDNSISGAGEIGGGTLSLDNRGTITATGSHALVIDTGDNPVLNSGTLGATGSGGLMVIGAVDNSGLVWANGGDVTIAGNLTGSGSVEISGTATLELGAAAANNVAIDATATGFLIFDHTIDFSGQISGLNADDRIDMRDLAFGAGTVMSYVDNGGAGGVLTISDGDHSVQLSLLGAHQLSDFSLSSDGHGGSLLTNTITFG
jgi:hypothetical protein